MAEPAVALHSYRHAFWTACAAASGVALVAALAWSLIALVEVWVIVLGALLVGATLRPAVQAMVRRQVPRPLAVGLTVAVAFTVGTVLLLGLLPTVAEQGLALANALPGQAERVELWLERAHARYPALPQGSAMVESAGQWASGALAGAFGFTARLLWLGVVGLSVLFLAVLMLLDGGLLREGLMRLLPFPQRAVLPALVETMQARVGHYMLGLGLVAVIAGAVTWASLALLGVPYSLLVGVVTAALQAIPLVGPLIATALAVALGLTASGKAALVALVACTVIQQVVGNLIYPVVVGRTVGIHPFWVGVVLLIGGVLYGLVGAFLAIPLAIAASLMMETYYLPWADARAKGEAWPLTQAGHPLPPERPSA